MRIEELRDELLEFRNDRRDTAKNHPTLAKDSTDLENVIDCFISYFPELFEDDELIGLGKSVSDRKKNLIDNSFTKAHLNMAIDELKKNSKQYVTDDCYENRIFHDGFLSAINLIQIVIDRLEE